MLISVLKYIKVLRHVSFLTDRHQGVGTPATCTAATTPGLIFRIFKFSVF